MAIAKARLRAIWAHTARGRRDARPYLPPAAASTPSCNHRNSNKSTKVPEDPVVAAGGLAGYAVALAEGSITAVDTTRAYLARIAAYDGKLLCYEHVATDAAMAQAAEADSSVAPAGASCTGLRGVPVGVKDIIAIRGMPVTCGSALEDLGILQISSLVGPEGSFIRSLRTAGAIFLGKTKTVEFASGGLGINTVRGTPWNPADLTVHRTPGGSSSGSAAGVAAGLCALSIGTDTGGSVRIPAALCGIFGLKTSVGRWSTDGVFPYSSTFDSIGLLTRSAADAAVAYSAIEAANGNEEASSPLLPTSLQVKLGVPSSFFYEDLEPRVAAAIDGVLTRLEEEGAELVPIDLSEELSDVVALRVAIVPAEFTQWFGDDAASRQKTWDRAISVMGSNVHRNAVGLEVTAGDYLTATRKVAELQARIEAKLRTAGVVALVTPTVPHTAQPVPDYPDAEADPLSVGAAVGRNVLPGSVWGLCGCSLPVQRFAASKGESTVARPGGKDQLPVGLQLLCRSGRERDVLELALAIESLHTREE